MTEKKEDIAFTLDSHTLYGFGVVAVVALLTLSVLTCGFGMIPWSDYCSPVEPGGSIGQNQTGLQNETQNNTKVEIHPDVPEIALGDIRLPPLGDEDAPVTLIEISDYECPYCGRLYSQTEVQLKDDYIAEGKAKLYFIDYPLSYHEHAMEASIAASCANDQGKYWEMHGLIFGNQEEWAVASDSTVVFEGYAQELELDSEQFSSCLASQHHYEEIVSGMQDASQWGLQGTPAMFMVIPKDRLDYEEATAILENIYGTYGTGGVTLNQDGNDWVVIVGGAYPYDVFDQFLGEVDY